MWVDDFETKFNISSHNDNNFKIIIGERPYKQKLNNDPLFVKVDNVLEGLYFCNTNVESSWDFGQVAFLVNNWAKIQDSIEMIFNILTGSSVKSLNILSYLREKSTLITPQKFAKYLFQNHNIILINKYNLSNSNYKLSKKDLFSFIANYGFSENIIFNFLFIGDNQFNQGLPEDCKNGYVLHSSGYNLNTQNVKYFNTWYQLDDNYIYTKYNHQTKPRFRIFKVLGS